MSKDTSAHTGKTVTQKGRVFEHTIDPEHKDTKGVGKKLLGGKQEKAKAKPTDHKVAKQPAQLVAVKSTNTKNPLRLTTTDHSPSSSGRSSPVSFGSSTSSPPSAASTKALIFSVHRSGTPDLTRGMQQLNLHAANTTAATKPAKTAGVVHPVSHTTAGHNTGHTVNVKK